MDKFLNLIDALEAQGILKNVQHDFGVFKFTYKNWLKAQLPWLWFHCYDMKVEQCETEVMIQATGKSLQNSLRLGFEVTITYHVYADGQVLVGIEQQPYGAVPDILPRLGVE